jgi:hypothetical protein
MEREAMQLERTRRRQKFILEAQELQRKSTARHAAIKAALKEDIDGFL